MHTTTTTHSTTTDDLDGTIAGRLRASWLLDGAGQLTMVWEVAGASLEMDYSSNPRRIVGDRGGPVGAPSFS